MTTTPFARPRRARAAAGGALLAALLTSGLPAQEETRPATRLRGVPAARLTPGSAPQEKSQEQLRAQRAEKLGKAVFEKADWLLDYDEARAQAAEQNKWILTYFTRSYAP